MNAPAIMVDAVETPVKETPFDAIYARAFTGLARCGPFDPGPTASAGRINSGLELLPKKIAGTLTAAEDAAWQAGEALWARVKAIRARSAELEASIDAMSPAAVAAFQADERAVAGLGGLAEKQRTGVLA